MKKIKNMSQQERLQFLTKEHHTNHGYWERKYPEAIVELTNGKKVLFDEIVDICQEERMDELAAAIAVVAKGKKPDESVIDGILSGIQYDAPQAVDLSPVKRKIEALEARLEEVAAKEVVLPQPIVEHKVERIETTVKEELSEERLCAAIKKHLPAPVEPQNSLSIDEVVALVKTHAPKPQMPFLEPPAPQVIEKTVVQDISDEKIKDIHERIEGVEAYVNEVDGNLAKNILAVITDVSSIRLEMASHLEAISKQEPVILKEYVKDAALESDVAQLKKAHAQAVSQLKQDIAHALSKASGAESIIIREEADLSSLESKLAGLEEALAHDPHADAIKDLQAIVDALSNTPEVDISHVEKQCVSHGKQIHLLARDADSLRNRVAAGEAISELKARVMYAVLALLVISQIAQWAV